MIPDSQIAEVHNLGPQETADRTYSTHDLPVATSLFNRYLGECMMAGFQSCLGYCLIFAVKKKRKNLSRSSSFLPFKSLIVGVF